MRYDLNIYDKVGHNTNYEQEGWSVLVYECNEHWKPNDEHLVEFVLTPDESRALTLGVSEADGGDYTSDSDFWIDPHFFRKTYKQIPKHITDYLSTLNYEEN